MDVFIDRLSNQVSLAMILPPKYSVIARPSNIRRSNPSRRAGTQTFPSSPLHPIMLS